jgi:hypothetical protein
MRGQRGEDKGGKTKSASSDTHAPNHPSRHRSPVPGGLKALKHEAWAFRPRTGPAQPRPEGSAANAASEPAGDLSHHNTGLKPCASRCRAFSPFGSRRAFPGQKWAVFLGPFRALFDGFPKPIRDPCFQQPERLLVRGSRHANLTESRKKGGGQREEDKGRRTKGGGQREEDKVCLGCSTLSPSTLSPSTLSPSTLSSGSGRIWDKGEKTKGPPSDRHDPNHPSRHRSPVPGGLMGMGRAGRALGLKSGRFAGHQSEASVQPGGLPRHGKPRRAVR